MYFHNDVPILLKYPYKHQYRWSNQIGIIRVSALTCMTGRGYGRSGLGGGGGDESYHLFMDYNEAVDHWHCGMFCVSLNIFSLT